MKEEYTFLRSGVEKTSPTAEPLTGEAEFSEREGGGVEGRSDFTPEAAGTDAYRRTTCQR